MSVAQAAATCIRKCNALSQGPGAIYIPSNVKALDLVFKMDMFQGHMGARKFWRQHLPSIQFYNPHLSVKVSRIKVPDKAEDGTKLSTTEKVALQKKCPSSLSLNFSDGSPDKVIDIRGIQSQDILKRLIENTGAQAVPVAERPMIAEQIPIRQRR